MKIDDLPRKEVIGIGTSSSFVDIPDWEVADTDGVAIHKHATFPDSMSYFFDEVELVINDVQS